MRFLMALLRALAALATLPLRLLGIGGAPVTPATIAAAAMQAEPDEAAAEEESPLGELIRDWAARRRFGAKPGDPALKALPPLVDAWLGRMDRSTLYQTWVTPAHLLERHVAAGSEGQLRSLGLVVPQPDVPALPANDDRPARSARPVSAAEPSLDEVLSDLGYKPALRYRG